MLLSVPLSHRVRLRKFWPALLDALPVISFLMPLLAHAYVGFFSRYIADDFWLGYIVLSRGFVGAQEYLYSSWMGRFSYAFAVSLAELAGPRLVPLLPCVALTLWLTAMTWTILQFSCTVPLQRPLWTSVLLAELILFATLDSIPNVFQSLYWRAGMLPYVAPLIIMTVYVGLIARTSREEGDRSEPLPVLILSVILTFVAGGFSEPIATLQVGALLLATALYILAARDSSKRPALPLMVAGLVGSTLAMVLMVRAPGNRVRQAFFPATPGLRQLAKWSLGYALQFVGRFGTRFPLTAALSLVLPALLAYKLYPQDLGPGAHARSGYGKSMPLVLLPVVGFILIVCCFVPVIYGTSSPPVDRVLVIPQFVLVCIAVCWAFLAGLHLRQCEILGRTSPLFYIGALAGLSSLAAGILVTPAFAANHLSPDGVLDSALVREISALRLWAAVAGGLLTLASVAVLVAKGRELPPGFTTTRRFLLILVMVALVAFGPVWSAWRTIATAPGARAYASRWDELDREIRAGKASPAAMAELTLDSGYGLVDSSAAQYYDALLNADKSSGIP